MINFLLGFGVSWLVLRFGGRIGMIDVPNSRSSHHMDIPKGAGLGILTALVASSLVLDIPFFIWLPVLIFIVGTANFYNFMDGIDGIAGITGVLAFLMVAAYAWISGMPVSFILLSLAMASACLGFLSLFYFDEIITMLIRIRDRDSLVEPHRKHIYQVLANEAGIHHWKIALGYGLAQLTIGISAMLVQPKGIWHLFVMYGVFALIFSGVSMGVRQRWAVR